MVTGASSGIGKHAAEELASLGYTVFAGVRRVDAPYCDELRAAGCVPLCIDVAKDDSVRTAAGEVAAALKGEPLVALVNNAGVGGGLPVELDSVARVRSMFDTNVVSLFRTCQAFVPMLREAGDGARIVNTASISSFVAQPGTGAYSASKFAAAGVSDVMRVELAAFGISVSTINPGIVRTALAEKAPADGSDGLTDAQRALYPLLVDRGNLLFDQIKGAPGPEVTTEAIVHAITSPTPKPRYIVSTAGQGLPAWVLVALQWYLPTPIMDRFMLLGARRAYEAAGK